MQKGEPRPTTRSVKTRAKKLLVMYHPDRVSNVFKGSEAIAAANIVNVLGAALSVESGGSTEEWKSALEGRFEVGKSFTFVGEDLPQVEIKIPRTADKFLDALEKYIETGTVSEEFLKEEKETTRQRGPQKPQWQVEEEDSAEMLKGMARGASGLEVISNLLMATTLYPRKNLEILGVFQEIDEAAQRIALGSLALAATSDEIALLSKTFNALPLDGSRKQSVLNAIESKAETLFLAKIELVTTQEEAENLSANIQSFSFSSERISVELLKKLEEAASAISPEIAAEPSWRPHQYERALLGARSLVACASVAKEIGESSEAAALKEGLQRVADSRARTLVIRGLNAAKDSEAGTLILQEVLQYPFFNSDEGFYVLDIIETKIRTIFAKECNVARTLEELNNVEKRIEKFPFRHGENRASLLGLMARLRQQLR